MPRKRDVFRRSKVKVLLSDQDIAEIINETYPKRNFTPEEAASAKRAIAVALLQVYAPREVEKRELRPLLKGCVDDLKRQNRRLDDQVFRMLLSDAFRVYFIMVASKEERAAVSSEANFDLGSHCDDRIQQVQHVLSQVNKWMPDGVIEFVIQQHLTRFKTRPELIRDVLPPVFEKIFKETCGAGKGSPGNRFIAAVLRKSGVHNGSPETIMATVVKTRQRAKKRRVRDDSIPPAKRRRDEGGQVKSATVICPPNADTRVKQCWIVRLGNPAATLYVVCYD
jgi:hypothetical protein